MGDAKKTKTARQDAKLRAVVDIGSNSVRLVVYDGPRRAPIAIFNEKSLCGLGRNITDDGKLDPTAVADALATLMRFRMVLDEFGSVSVEAIATAAVRDASDGANFIKAVKEIGFDVRLVSGEEEASLAAHGVVSFEPDATGLAGDMGGGSLELIQLKNGAIKNRASLSIGPLSLMREIGDNIEKADKIIQRELDSVAFLKKNEFKTLYTVGGAWRAVARIHMGLRHYPLSVLHHYELSKSAAIEICHLIARQSRRSLEDIPGIPRRRIDTLPYASAVLEALLKRMPIEKMVVSAGGVREGLLYEGLSNKDKKSDPLIDAANFYAARLAPNPGYGAKAFPVIEPLFGQSDPQSQRRRQAAAIMIDIGAYFHPDLRARQAFDTALGAPLVGLSHEDRIWIAIALYRRHEGRTAPSPDERAIGLLSWEDQQSATRFGLALRFVGAFSPKTTAALSGCQLELVDGQLIFRAPAARETMMSEMPRKRFASLAAAFEAEPIEIYEA